MMTDSDPAFEPLMEGIDYTVVNGKWIFTREFLVRRGYCCECGCRNCPYGFVPGTEKNRGPTPTEEKKLDL